jgi:hypothetical protein
MSNTPILKLKETYSKFRIEEQGYIAIAENPGSSTITSVSDVGDSLVMKPIQTWISELGLWGAYLKALAKDEQEETFTFALNFLKSVNFYSYLRVCAGEGGTSLHLICPDCKQLRGPELYKGKDGTYRCYKCCKKVTPQSPKEESTLSIEEPPCHCANVSIGHEANCAWKKWKHGS